MSKTLQIIIILIAANLIASISAGAEMLYVFYPSPMTAAAVQKKLGDAFPGIEIMVFGRFKDFKERVISDAPDAILTKPPVIEHISGYTIRLSGSRNGSTQESYVFLSINKKTDLSNLSGMSIGVFDILGRKGMKNFLRKFMNSLPKLRRVSKMEDLLQLLTFDMVKGILIPEVHVDYYKNISKLNFVITPFPNMKTGIIGLGVRQGTDAALIIKRLKALDKQQMGLLEVDKWK